MWFSNNHRIILLYTTVFLLISLITVFLPVWLNKELGLSYKSIGILLGGIGLLKIFSNILITKSIKSFYGKKITLIALTIIITSILFISILFKNMQDSIEVLLIFFILLLFSPVLPIVENICIYLNKNFQNSYGKLRVSGSLSFLFAVILIGLIVDKYGSNIIPFLFMFFCILFLISVFVLPEKKKKISNRSQGNIKKLLLNKNFMILTISASIIIASHAMYYGFSAIFWKQNNFSYFEIGILWGWGVIAEIFFFLNINKINIERIIFKAVLISGLVSAFRWIATYFFGSFYLLLLAQTLHLFSFGLTHYLVMYYIHSKITNRNKLIAQSLYHAISSGIIMTVFTIIAGLSFNYYFGGEGFLIMSFFCLISVLIVFFGSICKKHENSE